MAKYRITGPDGATYEVTAPDGASEQDVLNFVQQNQPKPEARPQMMSEAATRDEASRTQTPDQMVEASGFKPRPDAGERFGMGVGDAYAGAAQIAPRVTPDFAYDAMRWLDRKIRSLPGAENLKPYEGLTPEKADAVVKRREADYKTARGPNAGFDWMRLAGNVAGTAPAAVLAPATLPAAAAVGGVTAALQPVTEEGDFWTQKGIQTGTGMAGGAAGNLIGRGVARVISPRVDAAVKKLMDRGVTPTPGQIMGGGAKAFEEKLTSIPVLGDVIKGGQRRSIEQFNRAVYDDVLAPIGEKVSKGVVGRQAVAEVGDKLSQAYDDILPQLNFRVDAQFVDDLANLTNLAKGLPKTEARQFTAFLKDRLAKALGPQGQMDGRTFQTLQSSLADDVAAFGKSPDAYQKKLGDAFRTLLESLRDGLERSNQGVTVNIGGKAVSAADRLKNARAGWAKLVRLEKAAGTQGAGEGVFTPAQLASAVRSADQSVRKRGFARGDALMQDLSDAGKSVIGNVYPDSGTAGRLATMLLAGGAGMINPYMAAGAGTMMLPYTAMGQRLAAALLTQRPGFAPAVASGVRKLTPALQTGLAASLAREN